MKTNWHYFLWIPITIVYNFVACWVSVKYNNTDFIRSWLFIGSLAFIPTWAIAGYFSRNLIFDGMLYDLMLIMTTPFIMTYLGQAQNFSMINWIGVSLALIGVFLVKWH